MLILQRKPGESLKIGDNITITVTSIEGGRVRLAIDAPIEIPILRSELIETIAANQESIVEQSSANELLNLLDDMFEHHLPENNDI